LLHRLPAAPRPEASPGLDGSFEKPDSSSLSVMLLVGGLVSQPFDLEHHSRDKGGDDEEGHNGREGPFLNAWIHPDQRDQQQSRNAEGDRAKNLDRVC
jgi:hypothetical protein